MYDYIYIPEPAKLSSLLLSLQKILTPKKQKKVLIPWPKFKLH